MDKLIFLFSFFLLTSCTATNCSIKQNKVDNKIVLLNGVEYYLQDTEKEVMREEASISLHDSVFNKYDNFSWALYKVIADTSGRYKAFISIPVNIGMDQLAEVIENDTTNRLIRANKEKFFQRFFYEKDGSFIVSVLTQEKDFLWTYSILSGDSSNVTFLMNEPAFIKRINGKN